MTIELARPAVGQARRCALYRHYDASDVLLYVGITETLEGRTSGHARTSEWVPFAFRAEAEWHDTREAAARAEQDAIREEEPVFNRAFAVGDPEARIAAYLHNQEVERLKATLLEYQHGVHRFLELLPPDLREFAEEEARHDYSAAGATIDDAFPAAVLRHVRIRVAALTDGTWAEGKAEAYRGVQDFLAGQLKALLNPPVEEPPF